MAHAVATSPPIAIEGNERGACVSDSALFDVLYEEDQAPTSMALFVPFTRIRAPYAR